ncbi:MAG: uridine kinase [Hyphomonadaceae bacterium]
MARIIAITGGSGAGKTTVARALARRLGAMVIAEDDYYRCASTIADFDAATHNFDAPEAKDHTLLRAHLDMARGGARFEKPLYDLVTHRRRAEGETVAPGETLIVEGIHLLAAPDLRALYDFSVFIEADEAVRLGRRMIRDVEARGRTPRAVLAQFFASVRPMHEKHVTPQRAFADLVLNSPPDAGPEHAEADAARIESRLR